MPQTAIKTSIKELLSLAKIAADIRIKCSNLARKLFQLTGIVMTKLWLPVEVHVVV